jgi:hypothetical protein
VTPTGMTIHSSTGLGRCLSRDRHHDVRGWRLCWLLDAGFDEALARRLAESTDVDLHALLELVDQGCPPELAARILSPVTEQRNDA